MIFLILFIVIWVLVLLTYYTQDQLGFVLTLLSHHACHVPWFLAFLLNYLVGSFMLPFDIVVSILQACGVF